MSTPAIVVQNLSKTYSVTKKEPGVAGSIKHLFSRQSFSTIAVDHISFHIEPGELVGFLGPNGAGKTTTLKMLSGILYPSSGQVSVLGYTPWERKRQYQQQFSIVLGQKNQLWWDLPALNSFLLNKEIYRIPETQFNHTLNKLTDLLEVKDVLNTPVRKLSLGQRMKCELIAALLHSPKVLFLDEPTIGLDVVSQLKMRDFIRDYNQTAQTTIILTSHYMEDVEALCKRVIIIHHGQLIYDGSLQKLIAKHADHKELKVTFVSPVAESQLKGMGKILEYDPRRVVLAVPKKTYKTISSDFLQHFPVDDILIDEPNLDDVIRDIFTQPQA
ncbi:MAG: ABC transporter ATP-binding protein [Patescibacteria group bacterium]